MSRILPNCDREIIPGVDAPAACPIWEACLPFGGRLISKGGCVSYSPGTPPPDGIYSKIVIADGCITELHLADIPVYTSAPCAVVPAPCDGEGGSAGPDPSPVAGNMYTLDPSGRPLVRLSVTNGDGISVAGNGTVSNPLVITNTQAASARIFVGVGNSAITVTGQGPADDPYRIGHAVNLGGTYAGMVFDSYGHLTDYNPSGSALYVTGIVPGDGIDAEVNPSTGVATIALAESPSNETGVWQFGGWNVQLVNNRIQEVTPQISIAGAEYKLGDYKVTLNEYGSVTDLEYVPPPVPDYSQVHSAGSIYFASSGGQTRSMIFTTAHEGSFRIVYHGTQPTGGIIPSVDYVNVTGRATHSTRYDVLTPAIYAAGQHVITLTVADQDYSFTSPGYMDVFLTALGV